ncbi:dimer_Tnp_hAT domain-containing protein [Trichonephila clavipes]|uniref:Dimer_Tnp_hAT domain-containing protein n=1 Tax=Trichonephila clavipes TaxID=2585209 RepID=A0A8X6W5G4_TRICX|nr:dimer_Tnp_hAT domain-containing protein [Trichonephila clavipes]
MANSVKKQKLQDSKCSREFQTWWTEKYGMNSKGDKAVCVLCSGTMERYYQRNYKYFPNLKKNSKDLDAQEKRNEKTENRSLLKEVKTDKKRDEPAEIMHEEGRLRERADARVRRQPQPHRIQKGEPLPVSLLRMSHNRKAPFTREGMEPGLYRGAQKSRVGWGNAFT